MRSFIATMLRAAVLPVMWFLKLFETAIKNPLTFGDFLFAWIMATIAQAALLWLCSWPLAVLGFATALILGPDSTDFWVTRSSIFTATLNSAIMLTGMFLAVEFFVVPKYISSILNVNQARAFELARGSREEINFVRQQPPGYDPWNHQEFRRWVEENPRSDSV